LARREAGWLVVHAGLLPGWSVEDALAVSDAASERLACDTRWIPFLERVVAQRGSVEPDDAEDALAYRVGVLTRIRCVDRETGALAPSYTGPYETIPPSMRAWFDAFGPGGVKATASCDATFRVGHGTRAALGCRITATGWAVDDGCVWGQALAALRARDEHVVRVPDRNPDVA
jgi:bis(5'-nucleosyl)-tetraphosphatase (symmetrical)